MKLNRKQLRSLINETMKFRHDGRSRDQVSRDIKAAMTPKPEKRTLPSGTQRRRRRTPKEYSVGPTRPSALGRRMPANQRVVNPISPETQPADLRMEELTHYNNAQDKDAFMAGYNDGADDAVFDNPMIYGSEDSDNDPSSSMDDYALGYQLGYVAFS